MNSEDLASICGKAALCTTGAFAGAALFITAVEAPARQKMAPASALSEWRESFARAKVMQSVLAVSSCGLCVASYYFGNKDKTTLAAGLAMGALVPFTFAAIMPVNAQLEDKKLEPNGDKAKGLLSKWEKLHAVRTGLSLVAFATLAAGCVPSASAVKPLAITITKVATNSKGAAYRPAK